MLVRLDPGTDYPGHRHAGVEELHLLHGILKIDERTLYPAISSTASRAAAWIIVCGVKPAWFRQLRPPDETASTSQGYNLVRGNSD
jgi:hypothetical protein